VPSWVGPGGPPELVGVGVDELEMTLLEVGAGSGSLKASTQYDFPVSNLPHSAVMEGFYNESELSVFRMSSFGIVNAYPSSEGF
jgi:hypothetical protein